MNKSFQLLMLSSVSSIAFSGVAFAQVPNIEGNWKMSVTGMNISPTYTLIQKGKALTGTFRGPKGDLPLTGTVTDDKKVNFSVDLDGRSLKFTGTVEGKIMKGVADLPMGRKNWTATK